jgi:hypothetical protein
VDAGFGSSPEARSPAVRRPVSPSAGRPVRPSGARRPVSPSARQPAIRQPVSPSAGRPSARQPAVRQPEARPPARLTAHPPASLPSARPPCRPVSRPPAVLSARPPVPLLVPGPVRRPSGGPSGARRSPARRLAGAPVCPFSRSPEPQSTRCLAKWGLCLGGQLGRPRRVDKPSTPPVRTLSVHRTYVVRTPYVRTSRAHCQLVDCATS